MSVTVHAEGVTPAIIGRRFDALEQRLGVKLLLRTTRRISLTFEGAAFLEDCRRILREMATSSLICIRLGEMRRVVAASPDYLAKFGIPPAPTSLLEHNCLALHQQRGWTLRVEGEVRVVKASGTVLPRSSPSAPLRTMRHPV